MINYGLLPSDTDPLLDDNAAGRTHNCSRAAFARRKRPQLVSKSNSPVNRTTDVFLDDMTWSLIRMRLQIVLLNEGFGESSLSRLLGMQAAWAWQFSLASVLSPFMRTFGIPFALLPFSWPATLFSPRREIIAACLTMHGLRSRHQEPVLRVPADTFTFENVRCLLDDWIVPALVDDFLQSNVHNKGDQ